MAIGAVGKIRKLPRYDANDNVVPVHIMEVRPNQITQTTSAFFTTGLLASVALVLSFFSVLTLFFMSCCFAFVEEIEIFEALGRSLVALTVKDLHVTSYRLVDASDDV